MGIKEYPQFLPDPTIPEAIYVTEASKSHPFPGYGFPLVSRLVEQYIEHTISDYLLLSVALLSVFLSSRHKGNTPIQNNGFSAPEKRFNSEKKREIHDFMTNTHQSRIIFCNIAT